MNTFLESTNILGIQVTTSPKKEILSHIESYLQLSNKKRKPLVIVTPNPEQIVAAHKDKHFADILNQADVALPDGIGISLAAKFRRDKRHETSDKRVIARIPGVEFMEELVGLAAKNGWPVALIGGREGVGDEALLRLKKKYPGLAGWAEEPGELPMSNTTNITNIKYYQYIQEIIKKIKKTNTKLVFVGLGAPKQEYLIEKLVRDWLFVRRRYSNNSLRINDERLTNNALIFMSVGGSFDILAGRVRRAPVLIRSIGLEWLWRLILEPWRFRRQLALLKFLLLVVHKKLAL